MVTTPDRIKGLIELVESGASAEDIHARLKQIATLQPLDLIHAGRQFVEEATKLQEEEDVSIQRLFSS